MSLTLEWKSDSTRDRFRGLISGDRLGLLHIHLVPLLRLCVDLDDMLVLCMIVCCMATLLMFDGMLHVYVGHTCIPLSLNQ